MAERAPSTPSLLISEHPSILSPRRWRLRYRHRVLIARSILPFTWPILIELTCVVLIGIVTTVLVSKIGKAAIAAVGLSNNITYVVLSLFSAIALGGSVLIAQAFGHHDKQTIRQNAAQTLNLSIVISLLCSGIMYFFTPSILAAVASQADPDVLIQADQYLKMVALSYPAIAISLSGSSILRATGDSRTPAKTNVLMNILNIIISLPLIYGIELFHWSGLGILGAGIGICAARWIGAGMILWALTLNRSQHVTFTALCQPFKRNVIKEILLIGVPTSVESLMFNIGKLITQVMVAGMGTDVMAGNIITFSILLFVNIPGNALSTAATLLVGKRLGQGRSHIAQLEVTLILILSTCALATLSLLLIPLIPLIGSLYSHDPAVIHIVKNLIELNATMILLWSPSFILPAAFKGAKDVKYSMWTALLSMWGCRIVLGYCLGIQMGWGIYGIWLGMYADWAIKGTLYLYRLFSHRWLNKYEQNRTLSAS